MNDHVPIHQENIGGDGIQKLAVYRVEREHKPIVFQVPSNGLWAQSVAGAGAATAKGTFFIKRY
jgi:hypothetical protein